MAPNTKLNALTRRLGGIELSTKEHHHDLHTITLQYPAADLLPSDINALHLRAPALQEIRQPPPSIPILSGVQDTSFFLSLAVRPPNPFALPLAPDLTTVAGMLSTVDAAMATRGRTTLQAVSIKGTNNGSIIHKFRLQTDLPNGKTPAVDFTFDDQEFAKLSARRDLAWVSLLNHLIERRSAKAYYHVRSQLVVAYGEEAANTEEASWESTWHSSPTRDARQLLYARLFPDQEANPLPRGDKTLLAQFPCGHESLMRKIQLDALPNSECATCSCPSCGASVLQPEDFKELTFRAMCTRAENFVEAAVLWAQIDRSIQGSKDVVEVSGSALLCAISGALSSLRSMPFISPAETSFQHLRETQIVFSELEDILAGDDDIIVNTAGDLFETMLSTSVQALQESLPEQALTGLSLPPGFTEQLKTMLRRAIILACDRRCTQARPGHQGLHAHNGAFCLGVLAAESYETVNWEDDGTDEEGVVTMDKLTELLNGSSLD